MLGLRKDVLGMVRISWNEVRAGTFPDNVLVYIHERLNGWCTDSTAVGLCYTTSCHKWMLQWQPASELV